MIVVIHVIVLIGASNAAIANPPDTPPKSNNILLAFTKLHPKTNKPECISKPA
jgi:hypothetical protein